MPMAGSASLVKSMKPFQTISEQASNLLNELRIKYPRASDAIHRVWMTRYADGVFEDLVLHNTDKLGFDLDAFRIIHELQKIHESEYIKPRRTMIVEKDRHLFDPWSGRDRR